MEFFEIAEITRGPDAAEYEAHFGASGCDALLHASGDRNEHFHLSTGIGILQGIAVLTALGGMISRWFPGHGPANGAFRFHNPLRVGSKVRVRLEKAGKREAKCAIFSEGTLVFEASLELLPLRALERLLRQQGV